VTQLVLLRPSEAPDGAMNYWIGRDGDLWIRRERDGEVFFRRSIKPRRPELAEQVFDLIAPDEGAPVALERHDLVEAGG
jgi:hypothetical protein